MGFYDFLRFPEDPAKNASRDELDNNANGFIVEQRTA
jgi:hypothetical protein